MRIPMVTIEEHHEAFYVWEKFRRSEVWKHPPLLLHIDHHEDMAVPVLRSPFPSADASLSDVLEFVHRELAIDSFILAALYQKLLSGVHWLAPHLHGRAVQQGRFVACSKVHPLDIFTGLQGSRVSAEIGACSVPFQYGADEDLSGVPSVKEVLLDIDLDFFACNRNPTPEFSTLEVPRATYDEFLANRFSAMRLIFGSSVRAEESKGRYYFRFYGGDFRSGPESLSNGIVDQIDARIGHVVRLLNEKKIVPVAITVARSRFSGYTQHCKLVEQKLVEGMETLFSLERLTLGDL